VNWILAALLEDITKKEEAPLTPLTYEEVHRAITKLNTNKSPDAFGITAEHLKNAGALAIGRLTEILNHILRSCTIPETLKLGILTPVYKNKKSKMDPFNFRGITLTAAMGKVLEILLQNRLAPLLIKTQSPLQAGFTPGASLLNAAFVRQEAINSAKHHEQVLYIAFLDAKTAFDVVSHNSLARKLYLDGAKGDLWRLLLSLHEQATTRVKWGSIQSELEAFTVKQGVMQGGILSTVFYKRYNNTLLDQLHQEKHGVYLGDIHCPAPTCVDDIALVAHSPLELQIQMDIALQYSCMKHYELQPSKSMVVPFNAKMPIDVLQKTKPWQLGDQPVAVVSEATQSSGTSNR
jgi:hypothetical protein